MDIRRDANISDCGKYRLLLSRIWNSSDASPASIFYQPPKQLVFVMLNPSTADAYKDDPTIRRCIGFGQRNGYDMIHVANLYTGRATKPDDLFRMADPAGPECERVWSKMKASSADIICAWGADKRAKSQASKFLAYFSGRELYCLGTTKDGSPKHPLYLPNDTKMQPFTAYKEAALSQGGAL